MSKNAKEQMNRIEELFGETFEDISVHKETLVFYRGYLGARLKFPTEVTGREDFPWEEFYVLGLGDKREYEQLKRSRPSYTDIFRMTSLSAHIEEGYGLFVNVTRISDSKRFELPLADIKVIKNLRRHLCWCGHYKEEYQPTAVI